MANSGDDAENRRCGTSTRTFVYSRHRGTMRAANGRKLGPSCASFVTSSTREMDMGDSHTDEVTIDALLAENRQFPPSDAIRSAAEIADTSIYDRANADFEAFWAEEAKSLD